MVKKLEPGLTGEVRIQLSLLLVLISAVPCPIFTASVRGNGGGGQTHGLEDLARVHHRESREMLGVTAKLR